MPVLILLFDAMTTVMGDRFQCNDAGGFAKGIWIIGSTDAEYAAMRARIVG